MHDEEASPVDRRRFGRSHAAALAAVLVGLVAAGSCSSDDDGPGDGKDHSWSRPLLPSGTSDRFGPLPDSVAGTRVTRGAAAGYVDDQTCQKCHESEFDSYQSVGMAKSFYPPEAAHPVEKIGEEFHHERSGFRYVMSIRAGKYYLTRYCLDEKGRRFAQHEVQIAWVMGSGHNARSYIARNPRGELYQMPITWYADSGWAMSPGYDHENHQRFERVVDRGCMFCHNAYPEVPLGSDLPHLSDRFPAKLPHGIGCQRCHGPGARHVESAEDDDATDEEIRSRILNPAHFEKQQREDLCLSCHLQPESVRSRMMPRSFVRPMYSFQPGDDLTDFITYLDHGSEAERRERYEINHHGYRLRQSPCYTKSAGELTCVTCHDPHRKVPVAMRAAHYRKKCTQCHTPTDCKQEEMGTTRDPATSDCVSCHMVQARAHDVVHVTTTDHFIRRTKPTSDPTAPREEEIPRRVPLEITPYFPGRSGKDPLYPVYEGFGTAYFPTAESARKWREAFESTKPHSVSAYVNVGRGLLESGDATGALKLLNEAVKKFPTDAPARWTLGQALLNGNHIAAAIATLESAAELDPEDPGIQGTLADAYWRVRSRDKARLAYEKSLKFRPESAKTWQSYGYALLQLQMPDAALAAFAQAIARNPRDGYSYAARGSILENLGKPAEMMRTLEAGASLLDEVGMDLVAAQLLTAETSLRDPQAARDRAIRIARKNPENGRAKLHLALAQVLAGDAASAPTTIQDARRLGADSACCTMVEVLLAAKGNSSGTIRGLMRGLPRELETPSPERLRPRLQRYLTASNLGRR